MKRLFFAIPIPEDWKQVLLGSFPNKNVHGIRWVNEKYLHITAHFLGATKEEKLKEIIEQVKPVCESSHPFHLTFESLKTIFKDRKPVMIWAQFEESKEFDQLCFRLREAFSTEEKRKPLPHLTLARIKQLRQLPFELPKAKIYLAAGQAFSFEVNQLELWESHLDEKGATYEMIEHWKLGKK